MSKICILGVVLCFSITNDLSQNQINAKLSVSQVEGVAPLCVFFDATATTHANKTLDVFHDLHYQWNFGDINTGIWEFKPSSKNTMSGPMAAHVFDSVGVHIVELEVSDYAGNSAIETIVIRVLDPDEHFLSGRTVCFSTDGTFEGCPDYAQQVNISGEDLNEVTPYIGDNKRLLFKRGNVILAKSSLNLKWAKNLTIGAYGICDSLNDNGLCENAPVIVGITTQPIIDISSPDGTKQATNILIKDLKLISASNEANKMGIYCGNYTDQNLLYRLQIEGFEHTIYYDHEHLRDSLHVQELFKNIAIVDCHLSEGKGSGSIAYVSGQQVAIMGNILENAANVGDVIQFPWLQKGIILHNRFLYPAKNKNCLYLGSPASDSIQKRSASHQVVIADNHFETYDGSKRIVTIVPSDETSPILHNVIFERNFVNTGKDENVRHGLVIAGKNITIRNNIFNGSGASPKQYTGITISDIALSNRTKNVKAYNNTIYKHDRVNMAVGVKVENEVENAEVINNLVYSPQADDLKITEDYGTKTFTKNNIYPILNPFVTTEPIQPLDFQLDSASCKLDKGSFLRHLFNDFSGQKRFDKNFCHIGAFEYTENPITQLDYNTLSASTLHEYPNPSRNYLTIDLSKITGSYDVEIFDAENTLLYSDYQLDKWFYIWRVDDFDNGTYWVRISSKGATFLTKVVVER